jgi:antitoxin (DNA-binding transcriptional repressor) of toxin-antitoxin stability system
MNMQTITLEEAHSHLAEIIDKLPPGEEVVITRDSRPVARIVGEPGQKPHPTLGRGKGMLTIVSDDDEHLNEPPARHARSAVVLLGRPTT